MPSSYRDLIVWQRAKVLAVEVVHLNQKTTEVLYLLNRLIQSLPRVRRVSSETVGSRQ